MPCLALHQFTSTRQCCAGGLSGINRWLMCLFICTPPGQRYRLVQALQHRVHTLFDARIEQAVRERLDTESLCVPTGEIVQELVASPDFQEMHALFNRVVSLTVRDMVQVRVSLSHTVPLFLVCIHFLLRECARCWKHLDPTQYSDVQVIVHLLVWMKIRIHICVLLPPSLPLSVCICTFSVCVVHGAHIILSLPQELPPPLVEMSFRNKAYVPLLSKIHQNTRMHNIRSE